MQYIQLLLIAVLLSTTASSCSEPTTPSAAYTISSDAQRNEKKRQVVVLLDKRVPREELHLIAKEIKAKSSRPARRTFISYIIKNNPNAYWATTHFNPNLEVKLLGSDLVEWQLEIRNQRRY